MNILEAIQTRRSIRKYTGEPVSDQVVHELLTAAMSAPSAGNQQPWHFIVIRDKNLMKEITKVHPHAGMLVDAPLAVMICADETQEKYKGFWPQDCSAATQNLLLATHAHKLGSVWVGIYPNKDYVMAIRKLFGIPDHIIPFSLLPIGHPAETKPHQNRFQPDRIHTNHW